MTHRVEHIGDCTLYLGDCLEILPTLADGSIDFVFTDPPYGHNNNNGDLIARWEAALGKKAVPESEWRPIANDGPEANALARSAFGEFNRLLQPGCCCCCCCCGGGGPDPQFARWSMWIDEAIGFKQMIVWDKGPMGMGWHYRRSYETVLVAEKPGAACRWFDQSNRIENIIRPNSLGVAKILPTKDHHPTEKPVGLGYHFINLHTTRGHIVLDPFMGSGTTGVACAKLGRKFIGIEIEPKYFDIARRRIEDAYKQPDMFVEPPKKAEQALMFSEDKP